MTEDNGLPGGLEEFIMMDLMPTIADLQAKSLAHQFIVVELLRDFASVQQDKQKYLASRFDRVMSRLDQVSPEKRGRGDYNIGEAVSKIFEQAGR